MIEAIEDDSFSMWMDAFLLRKSLDRSIAQVLHVIVKTLHEFY